MPKVATTILNRNIPHLVDELVETLDFINTDEDLFILENGSDPKNYSRYSNLFEKETKGVSWGVNFLIKHAFDLGYDYIWVNYNDARVKNAKSFLNWAVSSMEEDPSSGIATAYWGDVWDMNGRKNTKPSVVSCFSPLSFVVSRKAVNVLKDSRSELDPFWDSSHFSAHLNMLGPCFYLYKAGMKVVTNSEFELIELYQPDDERSQGNTQNKGVDSKSARGFEDKEWKDIIGPAQTFDWLNNFFPQAGSIGDESNKLKANKHKRDFIIHLISKMYKK